MAMTPSQIRSAIRNGRIDGTSRGMAPGYLQCNVVIVPKEAAYDMLLYCQRNPNACPVIEVCEAGDPEPRHIAPGADVRTDVARYAVWHDGHRQPDCNDITDLWRDDLVTFLIGSGITFDAALERVGLPTDRYRWVLTTGLPTRSAGRFSGPLVVTMRWMTPAQAIVATQVTARFRFNHGAPIHIGDPAAIAADLAHPLFGGPVPQMPAGLVPVFWACGVTPQAAAERAGLDLMIAHAPAHSFISDVPAERLDVIMQQVADPDG